MHAKDINLQLHEISKDIYEHTRGPKGLVDVCGVFLLLNYCRTLTFRDWKASTFKLTSLIAGKQTYASILRGLPMLGPEHRAMLGNVLRRGFDRGQVSDWFFQHFAGLFYGEANSDSCLPLHWIIRMMRSSSSWRRGCAFALVKIWG